MTDLIQVAKDNLRLPSAILPEENEVLTYEHMGALTYAVAHCVKAAGECVGQAQLSIDKTGDFYVEEVSDLGISDLVSRFPAPGGMKKDEYSNDGSLKSELLVHESRRQDVQHSMASYQSIQASLERVSFLDPGHRSPAEERSTEHMEEALQVNEMRRASEPDNTNPARGMRLSSVERSHKRTQAGSMDVELGSKRSYESVFFSGQHLSSQTERSSKRHHFSRPYLTPISTHSPFYLRQDASKASNPAEGSRTGALAKPEFTTTTKYGNAAVVDDEHGFASAGTHKTSFSSYWESDLSDGTSGLSTGVTTPERPVFISPAAALSKPHPSDERDEHQATIEYDGDSSNAKPIKNTFKHELLYGKDDQVIGGSLSALVECLTIPDSTPDSTLVSTFHLTFRQFTTAVELANALIDRFQSVSGIASFARTAQFRVANVFKSWLESYWRKDCDSAALPIISRFATEQLQKVLPGVGERLVTLAATVSAANSPTVPRQLSSLGNTNVAMGQQSRPASPTPHHALSNSQIISLKNWKQSGHNVHVLDVDPLELARQLTLEASRLFRSIVPEELLAQEWTKKSQSISDNVKAMIRSTTNLTLWVSQSILAGEEVKRRSVILKHWVKVANFCLELRNYDSLMAIMGALDSASIARMKRTWDCLSVKTRALVETLRAVVDTSRNYAGLRHRLQTDSSPCIPFLGIYLTDLTFVNAGNPATRRLSNGMEVINFDKHIKTAKLISDIQRLQQMAYNLNPVQELQAWIGHHTERMELQALSIRDGKEGIQDQHYTRSLVLEPR
ncbi:MAG: hypothetical protein M1816_007968 [Peltula sp. TS41687]|nr:MAG: hypothetical protein M1816_007968 [Peltula sp. TS41687]